MTLHRRTLLAGLGSALLLGPAIGAAPNHEAFGGEALRNTIAQIEADSGGHLGIAVLDHGSVRRFAWRGGERFPMCSTFKLLMAGAVLHEVDRHRVTLARRLPIAASDLIAYAPFAETRVGQGATIEELCRAAMIFSDNAAANLLLGVIGGPAGLTRFVRTLGDPVTRLDRIEPAMSESLPGDPRDTTSPQAMLGDLDQLVLGRALSATSRARLLGWMIDNRTGNERLRAGIPGGWRIGDKTGTGDHGTTNDVAIPWPPGARPVLIASYLTGSGLAPEARNAVHARVARAVFAALTP